MASLTPHPGIPLAQLLPEGTHPLVRAYRHLPCAPPSVPLPAPPPPAAPCSPCRGSQRLVPERLQGAGIVVQAHSVLPLQGAPLPAARLKYICTDGLPLAPLMCRSSCSAISTHPTHPLPCNALPCNALPCNALPCPAMPCPIIQCNAVQCVWRGVTLEQAQGLSKEEQAAGVIQWGPPVRLWC